MKNFQLQFKEYSTQMEIDFNVVKIHRHLIEFQKMKSQIGRKRKWTEDRLLSEISKYNTLAEFRSHRPHLWTIYKHLVLLPALNSLN